MSNSTPWRERILRLLDAMGERHGLAKPYPQRWFAHDVGVTECAVCHWLTKRQSEPNPYAQLEIARLEREYGTAK